MDIAVSIAQNHPKIFKKSETSSTLVDSKEPIFHQRKINYNRSHSSDKLTLISSSFLSDPSSVYQTNKIRVRRIITTQEEQFV